MPGAARKGDSAGGTITTGSTTVFINGQPLAAIGDKVSGHGLGAHSSPSLAEGSTNVFVAGVPASRQGDKATCGHPATGSGNVFING